MASVLTAGRRKTGPEFSLTEVGEKLIAIERRAKDRQSAQLSGRVLTDTYLFPCKIQDLSIDGARLEFEHPIYVDGTLRLSIDDHDIEAIITVVWRQGSSIGVRFIGE